MAIRYRCDPHLSATLVAWSGHVDRETWLSHLRCMTADPLWLETRIQLSDLSRARVDDDIDEDAFREAMRVLEPHRTRIQGRRTAVVTTAEFERARRFESLARSLNPNIIVFLDPVTACAWLGLDPDQIERDLGDLRGPTSAPAP